MGYPSVSPAHAGMYPMPIYATQVPSSFPRTRGDVPATGGGLKKLLVFPPHTRGCTRICPVEACLNWTPSLGLQIS